MSVNLQPSLSSGTSSTSLLNPNQPKPIYDPTVPTKMHDPYNIMGAGSDIVTKSYLWLEALKVNPSNSNNAEVFLLYTANLAAGGWFGDEAGNDLSNGLLSIHNSDDPPKTLVAECVDIMMEQMVLTGGYTADTAYNEIYTLFPPSQNDPVSVAVRTEANKQHEIMNSADYKNNPPTQYDIQDEWYTFMTDPTTLSTLNAAQSDLLQSSIEGTHGNIYAALLVLLLLLMAAGIADLDAQGNLSKQLSDETAQLNSLITRWDNGTAFDTADHAQEWMNDLQNLQNDMKETPFSDAMMTDINEQFNTIYNEPAQGTTPAGYHDSEGNPISLGPNPGQAVDANGYPIYEVENSKNDNGQMAYQKDGKWYIEGTDTPVNADKGTTYQPVYWTDDPSAGNHLTDNSGSTIGHHQNPKSVVPYNNPPDATETSVDYYASTTRTGSSNTYDTYMVSPDGKAPPGATVYTTSSTEPNTSFRNQQYYIDNNGNAVFLTPPDNTVKVTLSDQAFHGSDYRYVTFSFYNNGSNHTTTGSHYGSDIDLQTSMKDYQPTAVNPFNPSSGGFSAADNGIISALDALTKPVTAQSNMVGAEMQQIAGYIKIYENTFESALTGDSGEVGFEKAINANMRA